MKPSKQAILDWIKNGMTFKPIVLKSSKVKGLSVELSWDCSEGEDGDYDFQDPDDQPLLRFDISKKTNGQYEELQDASFCTQLCALDDRKTLEKAARCILIEAERTFPDKGFKRAMEQMSWIGIDVKGKLY